MKAKLLCGVIAAGMLVTTTATADIPRPRAPRNPIYEITIEEDASQILYHAINGPEAYESQLRNSFTKYKVQRGADGLNQVICKRTVARQRVGRGANETYRCIMQSSENGRPLPIYHPPVRMG